MELLIKNKLISLGGSSRVTDLEKNDRFIVKGKVFTFTAKKTICDLNGNPLYIVRNKFFKLFLNKCFVLSPNGEQVAYVRHRFGINTKFEVTGYKDDIKIVGNPFGYDYHITKNGTEIGHVSRRIITLTDAYVLTATDDNDAAFLVALVIAIDNTMDTYRNRNNN